MSAVVFPLCLIATLLGASALAIVLGRSSAATPVIYGMTLAASLVGLFANILWLVHGAVTPSVLTLPLGLPWLGAHFRLDSLAAYFLLVINLGSAAASLYALGYGRHEAEPQRVLPFFALFLAGMNLVVVADDAFSFLVAWEFMSLASWALVMAHHREEENLRAGYVYILMASLGSLALLLAFGLLAGPDGNYAFELDPRASDNAVSRGPRPLPCDIGRGIEGRACAAPCLAAFGPSGGTEPCLGADERRHDQGRYLRFHPHCFRPSWASRMVVVRSNFGRWRRNRGPRHPLCADGG